MKLPEELQFIANSRMVQKTTSARMDGRVCIITGATSGVGLAAARRIAQGGGALVLVCRNREKAAKVASGLQRDHGTQVDVVQADLSSLSQVREVAATIVRDRPRLDVLINAQIEHWILFATVNSKCCRLLASLVATRHLTKFQRSQESL